MGTSLLDPGARSRRAEGLGLLAWFDDELLLSLLHAVPPEVCSRLACCSAVLRAFAGQEELWCAYCLHFLDGGGRLRWSPQGTWRAAFVCSRAPAGPAPAAPEATAACSVTTRVYSDVLYRSFFYAAVELDERWFTRETLACVDARQLSAEAFVQRFEKQSCPVLLRGCVEAWPAMRAWSRDALLERVGDVPFTVGPCDMPLREFYAYAGRNVDDAPLFVFDKHFARRAPELLQDYEVPQVFRDRDLFNLLGDTRPDFRWLLIGNRRSGSKWHVDPNKTSAWNAVVKGRKRWLLLPPGCPPPGVHPSRDGAVVTQPVSLIEWFFNFYSELRKVADGNPAWDLKEGTCGPGDAVYIPCGWWHCVLNLEDDTVAVTQNYASETHVHSIRRFLREKIEQVSGTGDKVSLADRFDTALAKSRPDLLAAEPQPSGDAAAGSIAEAAPGPRAFSFWDHLRSTGQSLTFGSPPDDEPPCKRRREDADG
uniref:JmjC domain-containing protein n=1 Tax=Alexandrium monilatum TaxID=311494 RepID=A0A6T0TPY8_9DINO